MQPELTNKYLDKLCRASADLAIFERDERYRASEESFPKQGISIDEAVRVFYALIHLEGKTQLRGLRLVSFQTFYNSKLAAAIFDYCVGSVAGEVRHALDLLTDNYKISFKPSVFGSEGNHVKRSTAIKSSLSLRPETVLSTALKVFMLKGWGSCFGGENWANITQTTMRKNAISNLRWIDEIIHCRHCSGKLFDRSMIFFPESSSYHSYKGNDYRFRDFLDYRREGLFEKELEERGFTYNDLLSEYGKTIEAVLNYKPVNFGFTELTATIKKRYTTHHYEESEHEEESEDETGGEPQGVILHHKTQKQINEKPYHPLPTCFQKLHVLKVYVSSKYNEDQKEEIMKLFSSGKKSVYLGFSGKVMRVYFLYPYISKGKTYLRKAELLTDPDNLGAAIQNKLFNQILNNTSDPSKIKIYIDRN